MTALKSLAFIIHFKYTISINCNCHCIIMYLFGKLVSMRFRPLTTLSWTIWMLVGLNATSTHPEPACCFRTAHGAMEKYLVLCCYHVRGGKNPEVHLWFSVFVFKHIMVSGNVDRYFCSNFSFWIRTCSCFWKTLGVLNKVCPVI